MGKVDGPAGKDASASPFATTRWSVVAAAADPARSAAALAELCGACWYPLYAFVRRRGHSAGEAEDLTQAFFARFLEKNDAARADPARGRFRTFLLAAMKHFLANEYDRARALKRGGGTKPIPFDEEMADARYLRSAARREDPESAYLRAWATSLLEGAAAELRAEYAARDHAALFDRLWALVCGEADEASSGDVAAGLGSATSAAFWPSPVGRGPRR